MYLLVFISVSVILTTSIIKDEVMFVDSWYVSVTQQEVGVLIILSHSRLTRIAAEYIPFMLSE